MGESAGSWLVFFSRWKNKSWRQLLLSNINIGLCSTGYWIKFEAKIKDIYKSRRSVILKQRKYLRKSPRSVFYQLLNPASLNLFSAAIGQSGAITGGQVASDCLFPCLPFCPLSFVVFFLFVRAGQGNSYFQKRQLLSLVTGGVGWGLSFTREEAALNGNNLANAFNCSSEIEKCLREVDALDLVRWLHQKSLTICDHCSGLKLHFSSKLDQTLMHFLLLNLCYHIHHKKC